MSYWNISRTEDQEERKKLKILMTLMSLNIGGAETHVVELCKELKKRGHEVIVASNGGVYEKELEKNQIKHYKVPMHNKKLSNLLKSYFMLKKIIIQNKIELVHAHARIPAFLCGLLKVTLRFKFLTTAHWIFKSYFPFNILTNWGEVTLAVSEDILNYLISRYRLNVNKVYVTVNGIDTEKFSEEIKYDDVFQELGLDKDKKHIVCVSRLDKDRSLAAHKLLDIANDLDENLNNNIEIIIVGDGNDMEQIKQKADLINKNKNKKIVWLVGARTDINKFLVLADIFVGVSRAALEAMAAKTPVILAGNEGYIGIFSEGNIKDAISTNFCCRGKKEISSDILKSNIKKLLNTDKKDLEKLVDFAYKTIQESYSVQKMTDDALEIYEKFQRQIDSSKAIEKDEQDNKIDIMISGYYGFKNNGDDTVLKVMVDDFRKKNLKIMVLSMRPWQTKRIYGVDSINRFNFFAIKKHLKNTSLLISGGGSLIQDVTSTHSLKYYLWIIKSAIKNSIPVFLYANGIGPVRRKKNRELVARVLNQVDAITLRDNQSKLELKRLKVDKPKILVTSDEAFLLRFTPMNLLPFGLSKENKYFVISVRAWRYNSKRFEKQIALFADFVQNRYKLIPVFVPMHPQNDCYITKKIMSLMQTKAKFTGTHYDTFDLFNLIDKAEFVFGMRLHTIIYAIKTATPIVAIVYDPKVKSLMQEIGYDSFINSEKFDLKDLEEHVYRILYQKKIISNELRIKRDIFAKLAEQNSQIVFDFFDKTNPREIFI